MDKPVALVTGAARRIGAAIARDLANKGWQAIIHYHQSEQDAVALSEEIKRAGGTCGIIRADLRKQDEVETLIPRCVDAYGSISCLINNASRFVYDNIQSLEIETWNSHIATNLTAPVFLCRDFYRQVPEHGTGVIINMLDQKTSNLNPDFLSYTVSKIGLRGLTRMLAMAFAPRVRVCGISPGITLRSGKQSEESFEQARKATPLGRSSSVEEIVMSVGFILSVPALNGEILTIDGGESLTRRARDVAFDLGID